MILSPHSPTRRASLAVLGLALAPLAACAPASSAHGLTIVATTTQICDYVTQIAVVMRQPTGSACPKSFMPRAMIHFPVGGWTA